MPITLRDSSTAPIARADRLRNCNLPFTFETTHVHRFNDDAAIAMSKATNDSHQSPTKNRVAVILGYFDGQSFVGDQIGSIFSQTHSAFHLFLCDDQSKTPFSFDHLDLDVEELSKLSVGVRPENIGCTKNFLNAVANVGNEFEYFAFSDQDDVWHKNKLKKAIAELSKFPNDMPALYCARTEVTDAACKYTFGYSPLFNKPPSFANSLVQNIGGGNTMVFNKAAKNLIINASLNAVVVAHDWWCYQIVTGAGGHVVYDSEPCLKYRQHAHNLVGANSSWRTRLVRIPWLLQGHFRDLNDINIKVLADHKHFLTKDNQKRLNDFTLARQSSLIKRLMLFKQSGIYRQTLLGNISLLLGVLLNKV